MNEASNVMDAPDSLSVKDSTITFFISGLVSEFHYDKVGSIIRNTDNQNIEFYVHSYGVESLLIEFSEDTNIRRDKLMSKIKSPSSSRRNNNLRYEISFAFWI